MDTNIQQEKIRLSQEIAELWSGEKNKFARDAYELSKATAYTIVSAARKSRLPLYSLARLNAVLAELKHIHKMNPASKPTPAKEDSKPTAQLHINAVVEFAPSLGKFVLKQGASQIVIESGINVAFLLQTHGGMIASPVTVSFVPAPKTFSGKFGQTWGNLSLVQQRYIEELEKKVNLR